jgi:rhomboid protease GluP
MASASTVPEFRRLSPTTVLIGLNAATFVAMLVSGVSLIEPSSLQLVKWGANWLPLSLGPQPWRVLVSNYIHIGILHIFLNMWCLLNLGALAERVFDRMTYIVGYTLCGLAGSVASLWWQFMRHTPAVGAGASGAIFGLAGMLLSFLYLGSFPLPRQALQPIIRSLFAFAGYNLIFSAIIPGIDNAAHIGGLIAGVALGSILAQHSADPMEVRRRWRNNALAGVAVIIVAGTFALKEKYKHTFSPQAMAAERTQRFERAIPELEKAAQQKPDSAQAQYILGTAYLGANQPDKAIAAFQKALQLQPNYAAAENALAQAYEAKGMDREAEDAYDKAERMEKNSN